jgi:hypothetical protein
MKRVIVAACLAAAAVCAGAMVAVAAPPRAAAAAEAPTVASLASLMDRELHWGMSHQQVTDTYNRLNGLFDREYAPQLAKLQPGVEQQQLEADRDNRKANFERSYTPFLDQPTGYDVTPLHAEYTYNNGEAVQRLFKDGKTRYFFYIKDRLWKIYDEVPLREGGALGASFQDAVTKLNMLLGVPARIRAADPSQGLDRTEADWQDSTTHLRAVDRSGEHLVGIVLEDRSTLANLASLRANKPADPFALDPSIAAVTKGGVSDPNAPRAPIESADAGAKKRRR